MTTPHSFFLTGVELGIKRLTSHLRAHDSRLSRDHALVSFGFGLAASVCWPFDVVELLSFLLFVISLDSITV